MISVDEAQRNILKSIRPIKETEKVDIFSSLGRIIAKDIRSQVNIPSFDNSAMDGYAVRSQDVRGASAGSPVVLKIIDDIPAGYVSRKTLRKGEASRIMTGAPMPAGADAVVIVEQTASVTSHQSPATSYGYVKIFQEVQKGANVRRTGEDVLKGEAPIRKGAVIRPQEMGMLASLGVKEVSVFRKPRVAILTTGSELVDVGKKLPNGKIRSSNTYTMYGQVARYGGSPVNLGIAKDNLPELRRKIKEGARYDMLVVSGGVSVGVYDFVKNILKELGRMKFWRVRMKPGKPLAFGLIGCVPVFGLPGNPVSSMVTFEEFVRPAILKMAGARELERFAWCAILKEDIYKRKGIREYVRVALEKQNGSYYARRAGPQGSGILRSMVLADGLLAIPEDKERAKKGETVYITPLQ